MPIRLTCNSCGKAFSAWDDLIGKTVKCPKCQHAMVVPGQSPSSETDAKPPPAKKGGKVASQPPPPAREAAKRTAAKEPTPTLAPPRARAPGRKAPGRTAPGQTAPSNSPSGPSPVATGAAGAANRTTKVNKPSQADGFDDSEALPFACPNCNQTMSPREDLCDRCGYHLILKKVINLDGVYRQDDSTGFERAVKKHLHDSESPDSMLLWLKIVAGFFVALFALLCFGKFAVLLLLLVGGGGYAFYHFRFKQHLQNDSEINQDPISHLAWLAFLNVQRAVGWRELKWPFAPTESLIMHDPAFDDEELMELNNLEGVRTLDLESTSVSDGGLVHLADFRQLQFLVLRKTKVTQDGVRRLQTLLPKTMIWS